MISKIANWLYNLLLVDKPKEVVDKVYYDNYTRGVFEIVELPDGTNGIWLFKDVFRVIEKPSDVIWLTCLPSKYFKD